MSKNIEFDRCLDFGWCSQCPAINSADPIYRDNIRYFRCDRNICAFYLVFLERIDLIKPRDASILIAKFIQRWDLVDKRLNSAI